jgi:hypothetical protein
MTKKEWAEKLNGREIGDELSRDEEKQLANDNLIVIFGASDDLMEIRGKINDEVSCYEGGFANFINGELYQAECDDECCPHEHRLQEKCFTVEASWGGDTVYSWIYKTEIPHQTFNIFEEGKLYCAGIIFDHDEICGENK